MSHTREQMELMNQATREIKHWINQSYPDVGRTAEATWAITNALIRNAAILVALGTNPEESERIIDEMAARMKRAVPELREIAKRNTK